MENLYKSTCTAMTRVCVSSKSFFAQKHAANCVEGCKDAASGIFSENALLKNRNKVTRVTLLNECKRH